MLRTTRLVSMLVLALVVAGCGKDGSSPNPPPPPPPGAYTCLGQPLPTSAADPVVVSGVIQGNVLSPSPLAGATLDAFRTGNPTSLATTISAANGSYTLMIATGGMPLDGYVRVTRTSYIDTYAYPPAPVAANSTQSLYLITSSEFTLLSIAALVTQASGNGFVAVAVTDCNGTAVAGATVSTTPGGTVRYSSSGGVPSASATATSADGVAYVFNVAAGDVVVRANSGSMTLRQHTVNARANAVTITVVAPGPVSGSR